MTMAETAAPAAMERVRELLAAKPDGVIEAVAREAGVSTLTVLEQAPASEPEAPAVAVIADEPAALPASIEAVVETVSDVEVIPATAAAVEASMAPAAEVDRAERLRSLFDQARESEPDVATTTNAAPPAPSSSDQAGDEQAPRSA